MNKKKTASNADPRLDFSPQLPQNFINKYKNFSYDELADECNKVQKSVAHLKLICQILSQDLDEYEKLRNSYSDSFNSLSKYLENLQTKEQNLNIKFSYNIIEENEMQIKKTIQEIKDMMEETYINSLERVKDSGGVEMLQNRQERMTEALKVKDQINKLKDLKKEVDQKTEIYNEKFLSFNHLSSQYNENWMQLKSIKEENQKTEMEIEKIDKNDAEIIKLLEEIEELKQKKKEIDEIKNENEDLLSQIEEEKANINKRKIGSILMLPSAQDQWGSIPPFQSQLSSISELKEMKENLSKTVEIRREKLEKAKYDLKEAMTVIQATMEAIDNYQQSVENFV